MGKYEAMGPTQAAERVATLELQLGRSELPTQLTSDVCSTIRNNIANREAHGFYTLPTDATEVLGLVHAAIGGLVIETPERRLLYRWSSGMLQTDEATVEEARKKLASALEGEQ